MTEYEHVEARLDRLGRAARLLSKTIRSDIGSEQAWVALAAIQSELLRLEASPPHNCALLEGELQKRLIPLTKVPALAVPLPSPELPDAVTARLSLLAMRDGYGSLQQVLQDALNGPPREWEGNPMVRIRDGFAYLTLPRRNKSRNVPETLAFGPLDPGDGWRLQWGPASMEGQTWFTAHNWLRGPTGITADGRNVDGFYEPRKGRVDFVVPEPESKGEEE